MRIEDEKTVKVRDNDILLIGWDYQPNGDKCVMTVARRAPGDQAELVNAFEGREALELYVKLTGQDGSGVMLNGEVKQSK